VIIRRCGEWQRDRLANRQSHVELNIRNCFRRQAFDVIYPIFLEGTNLDENGLPSEWSAVAVVRNSNDDESDWEARWISDPLPSAPMKTSIKNIPPADP